MTGPAPKLAGKVALVTGSGRGIGRAIAVKLASEGAAVVVNDLDAGPAEETVELVEKGGGRAVAVVGSVTAADFPDRFTSAAVEHFGGIDIVVNNAGFVWDAVIQRMTDEQWDAIVDLHLSAPFRLLRAVQPHFKAAALADAAAGRVIHRKVVNIASLSGVSGNPGQSNYAAAKAGLIGLSRTLAKEWGRYAVNVNVVAFGVIETRLSTVSSADRPTIDIEGRAIPIGVNRDILTAAEHAIPLGRLGTTEEAAGSVYLLCIPESDYVSGQVLVCGGGYTM
jgi:3-oxoacyl-[acyl-carrier protein] reductase